MGHEVVVTIDIPDLDKAEADIAALQAQQAALDKRVTALEQGGGTPVPPDPEPAPGWKVTFEDHFDHADSTPDPSVWGFCYPDGHRNLPDNGERQLYMDPSWRGSDGQLLHPINPFSIADSVLTICADHMPAWALPSTWNYWYFSGMIRTLSFAQQYGLFEARLQFPAGQGLWPAFWLLPADHTWPPELDPVEFFGGPNANGEGGPTKLHTGLVTSDQAHGYGEWQNAGVDLTAGFHTYAIDWDADRIVYLLDGHAIETVPTPADMHKPMYPIVNLAVGGHWPGDPPPSTAFPAKLLVDFVRASARK